MGLCLSKKDVLIQKPRQIFQDHGRAFLPDSPASTSLISGDSSSIAEKQLLKNSSIGSSCTLGLNRSSVYSNAAECGSRSSLGLGRYSSAAAATFDEDLEQSEARTSGFSYLSSPMIEGIDVSSSGLDQSVARKRFELDGGLRGDPIDEELEEEDFDEGDECGLKKHKKVGATMNSMKKKCSQMRSLQVFGEVFGENALMGRNRTSIPAIPTIRMASICENGKQKMKNGEELAVFGTEDHSFRSMNVFSKPKISMSSLSSSRQDCGDSGYLSEDSAQHTARSARWGFFLDSSGSDEMEGDDEASRVSSCSTQIEPSICKTNAGPFCDSSGKPAFMAVPPLWQQPSLNFSHMNPGSRAALAAAGNAFAKNESVKNTAVNRRRRSSDETTTTTDSSGEDSNPGLNLNSNLNSNMNLRGGFVRGFAAMPLQGSLLRPKYNPATGAAGAATTGSSSSSSFASTVAEDQNEDGMQKQTNPKQAPAAATISKQQPQDHDYDSDSSNDLFEIESLGAALGSLSSSSDKEKFVYPMNSAFLKDPDISHSTTIKLAPAPARNFQFQSHNRASGVASKGVGILGPTLRANVALGKQPRMGSDLLQGRKNFSWSKPQKKKTTANAANGHLENETTAFYEIR